MNLFYSISSKRIVAIIIVSIAISLPTKTYAQVGIHADLNNDKTVNISDVAYLISLIMNRNSDVAVTEGLCPNVMHPHAIDLGLPSGTKWTCCNMGAKMPTQYGNYLAWGESMEKDIYLPRTYLFWSEESGLYVNLGDNISGTACDVATVKWGEDYYMPSHSQIQELIDNCSYLWTTINGVNGGLFTATNGKKIFLPAMGARYNENCISDTKNGYYWSSTQEEDESNSAWDFNFNSGSFTNQGSLPRPYGLSVRPVTH